MRPTVFKNLSPAWPSNDLKAKGQWTYEQATEGIGQRGKILLRGGGRYDLLGSYSYLGLLGHREIEEAVRSALQKYGSGSHGVRLLAGTTVLHEELESEIADFLGTEDAIVFSSGYSANLSILGSICRPGVHVVADRLIHASLVDGIMLSGASFVRFRHNDPAALETCLAALPPDEPVLIVIDGVYSMEGDVAALPGILELAKRYGSSLMIDEAHSFCVLGPTGAGICEHFGISAPDVDILMGTLSKAIPAAGGYVAASREVCDLIRLKGRGYIYSGALPPPTAAAALAAIRIVRREPDRLARLRSLSAFFQEQLRAQSIPFIESGSPIVPVLCGTNEQAWAASAECLAEGIYVHAIVSPVVPPGRARLRTAVNVEHTEDQLSDSAVRLRRALAAAGVSIRESDVISS